MSPTPCVLCPPGGEGDTPHLEARSTSGTLFTSFSSGTLGGTGQAWSGGAGGSRAPCPVSGCGRGRPRAGGYSRQGRGDLGHRFHRLCQQRPGEEGEEGAQSGPRTALCPPPGWAWAWTRPRDPSKAGRHRGELPAATSPRCPRSNTAGSHRDGIPNTSSRCGLGPGAFPAPLGHLTPHSHPIHTPSRLSRARVTLPATLPVTPHHGDPLCHLTPGSPSLSPPPPCLCPTPHSPRRRGDRELLSRQVCRARPKNRSG